MSLDNYLGKMEYHASESCKYEFESQDLDKPVLEKKQISVDLIRYDVKPNEQENETNANVTLYWDWVKREWFAKVSGDLIQDYGEGVTRTWPFSKGPFKLNESACRMLLEAYRIPESKIAQLAASYKNRLQTGNAGKNASNLLAVTKTSPRKLARLNGK